jgi:septal ring factor EnvC (AmiA/AmiB activator)
MAGKDNSSDPWWLRQLQKEQRTMKSAPLSVLVCVLILASLSALAIWWAEERHFQMEISSLNAAISANEATIRTLNTEKASEDRDDDKLRRENDKLRTENASATASRADKSIPIKGRAKILSQQLIEFADRWEKAGPNMNNIKMQLVEEWRERFHSRLKEITSELDALGQYSSKIGSLGDVSYISNLPSADVIRTTASELTRMADAVSEKE